jgi:class 3 adenylate cyclase
LAYDLTTVGDVVNTTSRLESEAAGGEISFSARMADALGQARGEQVEVAIKGKARPVSPAASLGARRCALILRRAGGCVGGGLVQEACARLVSSSPSAISWAQR